MRADPKIAVTAIAAILVLVDTFWHPLSAIGMILILVALAPWMGPWFISFAKSLGLGDALDSVELPGFKVQFRQRLAEFEKKSETSKPSAESVAEADEKSLLQSLYNENPGLALAGLRVELERRLRQLARTGDTDRDSRYRPLRTVLDEAIDLKRITREQSSLIRDIIPLLNDAIHAKDLRKEAADWAIRVGPPLLASLDKQIDEDGPSPQH